MLSIEVLYKGSILIPLAAFDDGLYASMLIVGKSDGVQRASGVLGHFTNSDAARKFAVEYGMAEIDHRCLPYPEMA